MPLRNPPSLTARALRLLTTREHSRAELVRKLQRHAPDALELERVLDQLTVKGFISEQRVVESVIHRRASTWGEARLRQDLREKGVDDTLVREALQRLRDSEARRAWALWRKKFPNPGRSENERLVQMRFLASRGFATEIVRQVVAGRISFNEDQDDSSMTGVSNGSN